MKRTVFKFGVHSIAPSSEQPFTELREKLGKLPGVKEITIDAESGFRELQVYVEFSDAIIAKKLHRKVMSTILAANGISITHATTMLTDVF